MYKSKKPYFYGTGRRKSSVARVHLFENGTGAITINGRDIDDYFGLETLKLIVRQPLVATEQVGKVDVVATVTGGGVTGQAGAIRHGIARALLLANAEFRPALKAHPRPSHEGAQEVRPQGRPPRPPVQQALKILKTPEPPRFRGLPYQGAMAPEVIYVGRRQGKDRGYRQ